LTLSDSERYGYNVVLYWIDCVMWWSRDLLVSEGEELDDEAIERRRAMIREKAKKRALEDVRQL
jgi:hypothetical protein